ncbi:hypothetical protein NIES2135_54350 [Leptolyngbya boryana NIES-2135]|jgi:hypothetical protein|uniref:Uncharacterized protein n=1 Tax=Leptolyngbya boryana NIES-2135 TaxID=1973484 RepID=A0A1Z4JPA7_LEPBY|nr:MULTISPECIES: hypothetical protein [Leptolyngbya]BAY58562.1 hypothetical protein NIES2135_54350 [Leptolyngbya boryana NIES-2135]MBD2370762.1 hypothetical protein [Leptolyngbya sp. FACHB-161]MBD2377085.1 hypothetical protein [Leptolyngbya sp. FACHB-238]MBD2401528.1 hypothetical protein [Leptolyngbya sp. FACHB-239]MBD2408080.1 hypothetical protein [Leptolyngbya sp. FACHB-402]
MSELIPSDAVKAIQESVETQVVMVDDHGYLTRPVHLPPKEPVCSPVALHTLTGLVDFIESSVEGDAIIHVVNHYHVEVIGQVQGRYQQRPIYAAANCKDIIGNGFTFGQYQSLEQFVVNVQAQFVDTEQRATVLRVVGNIRQEQVKTSTDDGVTQQVVTSAGIARVGNAEVPNPVALKPYRTFPEVEQPESNFVLRLKQAGKDELPLCALFEADGGAWKLGAIAKIKTFLDENLNDSFTIVA